MRPNAGPDRVLTGYRADKASRPAMQGNTGCVS